MKVRGERECRDCGARWSYYETGSVACPDCGSPVSVGVDDPTRHTDGAATLDLEDARAAMADDRLGGAVDAAAEAARDYLATRGFVDAGDLTDLDDAYVAAAELRATADLLSATLDPDDAAEAHFLSLLRGAADAERPDDVPDSIRSARGLAAASAVAEYRGEAATWLDDRDAPPEARATLERLGDHATRFEALDGDVDPADADRLVAAARDLGTYLREEDASALESARTHLDRLG